MKNEVGNRDDAGFHYDPFGMILQGRIFPASGAEQYRFGFNGKENTDELYGKSEAVDFGSRIYDARLGRWLSVDPIKEKFPHMSPYVAIGDNPIIYIDIEGKEIIICFRENKDAPITAVIYGNDGKLYDRKIGEEYTGDNSYIQSVKGTLDNLKTLDEKTALVVNDLVTGEEKHVIANYDVAHDDTPEEIKHSYNVRSRNADDPTGSYTKYVPDQDRELFGADNSDSEILGHELKHGYNRKYGIQGEGSTETGVPLDEVDAVNFQNIIRAKEHKDPRTSHGRKDIPEKYLVKPENYDNFKK